VGLGETDNINRMITLTMIIVKWLSPRKVWFGLIQTFQKALVLSHSYTKLVVENERKGLERVEHSIVSLKK
jgi:hypothetical protein